MCLYSILLIIFKLLFLTREFFISILVAKPVLSSSLIVENRFLSLLLFANSNFISEFSLIRYSPFIMAS